MKLEKIIEMIMEKGVAIAYSFVILVVAVLAVKIFKSLIYNFFTKKMAKTKMFDDRKAQTMASVTFSIVKYTIYFLCICTILSIFGVPVASLIAVAGVGSVAIGFGAQSIVKDILAGFFIILEDQFGVGDIVTIEGKTGTVESINMRTTHLRGYDGTVYIIPNGTINIITNMCKDFICAVVNVDVSYSENVSYVIEVLKSEMDVCFKEIEGLREVPKVLGVMNLGDSGVTIRIVAECEVKENYRIERELKLRIKHRFDQEKIVIPFPQRTVHVKKEG